MITFRACRDWWLWQRSGRISRGCCATYGEGNKVAELNIYHSANCNGGIPRLVSFAEWFTNARTVRKKERNARRSAQWYSSGSQDRRKICNESYECDVGSIVDCEALTYFLRFFHPVRFANVPTAREKERRKHGCREIFLDSTFVEKSATSRGNTVLSLVAWNR